MEVERGIMITVVSLWHLELLDNILVQLFWVLLPHEIIDHLCHRVIALARHLVRLHLRPDVTVLLHADLRIAVGGRR